MFLRDYVFSVVFVSRGARAISFYAAALARDVFRRSARAVLRDGNVVLDILLFRIFARAFFVAQKA